MRNLLMRSAILAGALLLSGPGWAATELSLSGVGFHQVGPQSTSNPCVIAGTQCQQPANFGFNNFNQTAPTIDAFSSNLFESLADNVEGQAYTVGQIINVLGGATAFNVNLDVNTTSAASENLRLFRVRIGGQELFEYNPGPGGTPVGSIADNGNGFADWQLSAVNLAGFDLNTPVIFFAAMTGLVDGAESFFLTPASVSEVPIPGAMLLMGPVLGMAGGVGWWRKRRRRSDGTEVGGPLPNAAV